MAAHHPPGAGPGGPRGGRAAGGPAWAPACRGRGGVAVRRAHEKGHNHPTAREVRIMRDHATHYDPFLFEKVGLADTDFVKGSRPWDKEEGDYTHLDDHLALYRKDCIIEAYEARDRVISPLRPKFLRRELEARGGGLTLVHWYTEWCATSPEYLEELEAIGRECAGFLRVFRIEYSKVAQDLGLCEGLAWLPAFQFYRGEEVVETVENPASLSVLRDLAEGFAEGPAPQPAA